MAKNKKEKDPIEDSKDFEEALGYIENEFGKESITTGRGIGSIVNVDVFPTGVAAIDLALGCGGLPQGRMIELFGAESSGKTTTCLQIIASCQKHYFPKKQRYGRVVFIDAEHALDPEWAEKIGVDMEKMAISQPDSGEQALRIAERLIKSKKVDLIVIDSVAALIPQAELEGQIGDHHVGAQARMMSQSCRMLRGICSKTLTSIIFINQIREKVGIIFGSPEVTPGGRALKFYASVRGQISKGSALKDSDSTIGFRPTVKFVKNKVGPPFTSAQYDICVGHKSRPIYGIDCMASLIDVAKTAGIITMKGNFYRYNDKPLGNGLGQASMALHDNTELAEDIRKETYDKLFGSINEADLKPESIDDEIIDSDDD